MISFKEIKKSAIFLIFSALIMESASAYQEIIEVDKLKQIAIPMHLIELFLAVFICFMALKFFWITKPINLFLVVYIAGGFFAINSLLYLMLYSAQFVDLKISFVNVYLGSRIALIGMLISLAALFYYLNKQMRRIE